MNYLSLSQRIIKSQKPYIFFHTWEVTRELLSQVIAQHKTIDLDISVNEKGEPYLGHSDEYHQKSAEPYFHTMPFWEAVEMVAASDIFVMVDCKNHHSWPVIEAIVEEIGPQRCLVCGFANELKFGFSREPNEPDFLTEWSPLDQFTKLKDKFPAVTITPCSKWLPQDLFTSEKYTSLIDQVRDILKNSKADTVCLSVPDETITDKWINYFLDACIILHIMVDHLDTTKLSSLYIGETDYLEKVSPTTQLY